MRVLLIAARDPGGRRAGRKQVLATAVASMRTLGHEVHVLAFAKELDERRPDVFTGVPIVRHPPPGLARVALSAATRFTTGRASLNECLYDAPDTRAAARSYVAEHGIDVVVADTVRTVAIATGTGAPVVADLDDLLSDRYAQLLRRGSGGANVLGYYAESLPGPLRPPAGAVARRVLGLEARVLRRREALVARSVAAVSLVGAPEAAELQRRAGVPVDCLPMSVPIPTEPADVAAQPCASALFVGGLDYHPNFEAVAWFADAVLPVARAALPDFELHVVGHCPADVAAELGGHDRPGLVLRGYVDDLAAEQRAHRAFVAPIRSGTGVKTKVVEAMAAGLPVVSTRLGIDGTGAVDGEHCLLGDTPQALVAGLVRLAQDAAEAARIGAAARSLAIAGFAPDVLAARWERTLARATHGAGAPDATQPT
ncbi:MAG TPA: glycosyltransferase [Baekduia sp.]|uniref:glycosyltransferase n=1 Tax=Baekduia sp. TaxID=2600305 RepID=UPI002C4DFC03|nr:glycosyltransferase [Baekduia sp.]HMJ34647.1 glycosyltransferase [Baekduia sp.]